ncbi:hypothetical protein D0S45_14385 [Marinifilum sp. JC120]|nr:hypothetical protein D0S45_14385 [Marinifilum sp. JC120]
MACCVGVKHGYWCSDRDASYIDGEGNEYCIFHAPAEHKYYEKYVEGEEQQLERMPDTEFNNLVISRINSCIQDGKDEWEGRSTWWGKNPRCNLSGTIFPTDISFESIKKFPAIKFDHCTFKGIVDFSGCEFETETSFFCTLFELYVVFADNIFAGNVSFDGSIFDDRDYHPEETINCYSLPIDFEELNMTCGCSFYRCTFRNNVSYRNCKFKKKIKFEKCNFEKGCTFLDYNRTTFDDEFCFIDSTVNERFDLGRCVFNSAIEISNCDFYGISSFKKTIFIEARFLGSQFYKNAAFAKATISKHLTIVDCKFEKEIMFANANINFLKIIYSNFNCPSYFSGMFGTCRLYIGHSHFEDTVRFNGHTYNGFQITGCSFKKLADFSSTTHNKIPDQLFKHYCCSIKNCTFDSWAYFKDCYFNGIASFENTICGQHIIFERAELFNVSMKKMHIESFQFVDCFWHKNKKQYGPLYNENPKNEVDKLDDTALESTYRRLKKIAKDGSDEVQTSYWHFKEKEWQRKRAKPKGFYYLFFITALIINAFIAVMAPQEPTYVYTAITAVLLIVGLFIYKKDVKILSIENEFEKFYLQTYYYISGYGEKPLRAFGVLGLLIIFPFLLDGAAYIANKPEIFNATGCFPLLDPVGKSKPWEAAYKLIITLQAALFAFALRNKLRR